MRFRTANAALMKNAMTVCMDKAGIHQVDYIVTHTSNRKFWDSVAALCRLPREKFLDGNICNTGHMNSHDSFYHYFIWCERGIIRPGDISLLVNPGFGGTQGCTILRR